MRSDLQKNNDQQTPMRCRVREIMTQRRVSLREFARLSNVDATALGLWLRGRRVFYPARESRVIATIHKLSTSKDLAKS